MVEPALRAAPAEVREEAQLRFEEIAAGLEGIPAESVFWASAKVSQLRLVVRSWTFFYTLDGETLRVTDVRRSRPL
jgi:hypothetical protein